MGVYSRFGESGVIGDELLAIDPSSNDIQESAYDISIAGAYEIMAENEHNYNQLMKAVGIFELKSLEENGEVVYEAADIKGFIDRIKAFFVKILQKVASVVKKFFALVDSMTKNDKDFIKKYQPALNRISGDKLKDLSMDLYKYTNMDWDANSAGMDGLKAAASQIKGIDANMLLSPDAVVTSKPDIAADYKQALGDADNEDIMDAVRGSLVGKSDVDSSDFSGAIHAYFRDGEDSRSDTDVTTSMVQSAMKEITNTKDIKKAAQKNFDAFKKIVDKLCKSLDTAASKIGKDKIPDPVTVHGPAYGDHAALLSKLSSIDRGVLNLTQTVFNGQMSALKERNAQARHICVRAMSAASSVKKEGFEHFTEGSTGSFFDNVTIR